MFERVKYEFIFCGFQHVLSAWPDDQPKVHWGPSRNLVPGNFIIVEIRFMKVLHRIVVTNSLADLEWTWWRIAANRIHAASIGNTGSMYANGLVPWCFVVPLPCRRSPTEILMPPKPTCVDMWLQFGSTPCFSSSWCSYLWITIHAIPSLFI
jgi:hypothetical protein